MLEACTPKVYQGARRAVLATLEELATAVRDGRLKLTGHELRWLHRLQQQAAELPEQEDRLVQEVMARSDGPAFQPAEYGYKPGPTRLYED